MKYPRAVQRPFWELPEDPQQRHEFLVDMFGTYVFWAIDEAIARAEELLASAESRKKMGNIPAKPYAEAAEKLSPEQRRLAVAIA